MEQITPQQPPPGNSQFFHKKGSMVLLLLTLIVLIGGYLIWAKTKSSWPFSKNGAFTASQQSAEDNFQKPSEQMEPGTIALVVKKENYDSLASEISTWTKDVERETKNNVEVKIYENNVNKEKVKTDLKNLYYSKNLRGAVLIGNIPYARAGIHCSSYPQQILPCLDFDSVNTVPFGTENLNIDDYFYTDIESKCQYNQKLDAFYTDSCSKDSSEQPFWISRLTPPLHNLSEANRLLKNYFVKNHKFRTREFSFEHKLLTYAPVLLDFESEPREASVKNFLSILA
ncbi:MAG: hypothetical protein U1A16_03665, partial [Patescibacteria group bacterium]|nr:hypothetical protein [Patescibacteria group bacterium]